MKSIEVGHVSGHFKALCTNCKTEDGFTVTTYRKYGGTLTVQIGICTECAASPEFQMSGLVEVLEK